MQKSTHTAEYDALRAEIQAARAEAGLSQRELAIKLSVPHSWVSKVENGERRIDLIEFFWLIAACEADPIAIAQRVMPLSSRKSKGGSLR